MATERESVGVVVFDANPLLNHRLSKVAAMVWGNSDVLPRHSLRELRVASNHLDFNVVIVRASAFQAVAELQRIVFQCYERGSAVVVIQDTNHKLTDRGYLSFGNLYYLSDQTEKEDLVSVLTLCLLKKTLPGYRRGVV